MKEEDKPTKAKRGRPKGAQNKATALTKEVISSLLNDYHSSGLMSEDFLALEPKDRIQSAEKMMQYILPKMQSTAVDFKASTTKITIEQKLRDLSRDPDDEQ